eukprot:2407090-Rhodomonas_salina.3
MSATHLLPVVILASRSVGVVVMLASRSVGVVEFVLGLALHAVDDGPEAAHDEERDEEHQERVARRVDRHQQVHSLLNLVHLRHVHPLARTRQVRSTLDEVARRSDSEKDAHLELLEVRDDDAEGVLEEVRDVALLVRDLRQRRTSGPGTTERGKTSGDWRPLRSCRLRF